MKRGATLLLLFLAGVALAQRDPAPVTAAPVTDTPIEPTKADDSTCARLDITPGGLLEPDQADAGGWSEFTVEGGLLESAATVHALLAPTIAERRGAADMWPKVAVATAKLGYQLVGHAVRGRVLVLHLAPLPIVRKVTVDTHQSLLDKLVDEEIRRRMRLRVGSYLPWEPVRKQCAVEEEKRNIREYLHDEGYFDAKVEIDQDPNPGWVKLHVDVRLGEEYLIGKIDIPPQASGESLAISDSEVRAVFAHKPLIGNARFTRTQHQEDIQSVKKLFQTRGYPGVRVQSSFDPQTSFDRRTHRVNVVITIDQRRRLEVVFEGQDPEASPEDQLREKLTFNQAGSADDVEVAQSASAITTFLQERGFFDARVTWSRERFESRRGSLGFDRVTFRIDVGRPRQVASVQFVGNTQITSEVLADIVVTKEARLSLQGALFGVNTAATSEQLAIDEQRIVEAYRRAGYREATVHATASPDPLGLSSAALTAMLVASEHPGDLHVRYTIDEGQPTLLDQIEIVRGDGDKTLDPRLCEQILGELAAELAAPVFRRRSNGSSCTASASDVRFRENEVAATRDRLRDWLFKDGRPRSTVAYTKDDDRFHVRARFTLSRIEPLTIGKVAIRGNFKTRDYVIEKELRGTDDGKRLVEGERLTTDALAETARRLRNLGLFDAVNIDLPEIADRDSTSNVVNAIVRVEERYDYTAQIDVAVGVSSVNGYFATLAATQRNLFGYALALTASGTYGTKIKDFEATFQIPQVLVRDTWVPIEFRTDLTGLYREQDTPRFGLLTTEGATVGLTRAWSRARGERDQARVMSVGAHYDFRLRSRNVDVLRPIGTDMDQSQVAISTRSGSVGLTFDWEQRVDRQGSLNPLAAENGYHLEASVAYYAPLLLGQDTFVKVSAAGSKFIPIGKNLVIRGDLRYDEGFPLNGAVLLPEVERFFAGGDNTVRGYGDDRMATEIVQVALPPVSNISQIRVIPSGGNIRMLASVDAQLHIWSVFAGAIFSDAGMISNQWSTVTASDIRPSVGTGLRILSPFGIGAVEYAVPLQVHLGDDPRGRLHVYFAARAQF